jgi:hypothetical protein
MVDQRYLPCESVSAAKSISVSPLFSNLCFRSLVKETCHDIYEAHCFMLLKKSLEVLDFSLLQTFWKKVEENCTLILPRKRPTPAAIKLAWL